MWHGLLLIIGDRQGTGRAEIWNVVTDAHTSISPGKATLAGRQLSDQRAGPHHVFNICITLILTLTSTLKCLQKDKRGHYNFRCLRTILVGVIASRF